MLDRGSRGKSVRHGWKIFLALVLASWSIAHAGQPLTLATGQSVEILAISPLRSIDRTWSAPYPHRLWNFICPMFAIPDLDTLG